MKHSLEGVVIGIASGVYVKTKTFGFIISKITWEATLDTAYYAIIGALVGLLVTTLGKYIGRKIKSYVEKD